MFMTKARAFSMAFVFCLCVCAPACASDLVGTWIAPDPNPYAGQHKVRYPNIDAFTQRFVFARDGGNLTGIHVTLTGKEPLGNLKVEGQTISFSQGSKVYDGEIHGDELQLSVRQGGASK